MSELIRTLELKDLELIAYRDVTQNELIRSINVDQISGNFVVTKPLNTTQPIVVYPQSPNNPSASFIGEIKYLYGFSGYGFLNFPLDAKFDFTRSKLWIADSANRRVLQLNASNFGVGREIKDITLPCVVCPNVNTGGVFVRAFIDGDKGVIYHYDQDGILLTTATYDIVPSFGSIEIVKNIAFVNKLPISSSMAFDHTRHRLWWANNGIICMMDTRNKQIVTNSLVGYGYDDTRGIDIEFKSGNCFVVAKNAKNQYWALQMSKDNSQILSSTYIAENPKLQNTGGQIVTDYATYPSQLKLSGFANTVLNGTWDYISDMSCYNNTSFFLLRNSQDGTYDGSSGFMAWGKYIVQQNVWRFFVAQYDMYPIISTLWVYSKMNSIPYGTYTLESYDSIFDQPNPYANDHGVVS